MSDTADYDLRFLGRQVLKQSRTAPLRARMESFVAEHDRSMDVETLRRRAVTGESLSEIVNRGRDEQI